MWVMLERLPPHAAFVFSAIFHYLGPAFAVLLFARVDVLGVAWLRIAAAALIFALWRRPWHALKHPTVIAWGVVLALMNCCFYLAIDRLPLATVAAIEFLPVIALAALGARSRRNALALALAVPGVYLLTGVHLEGELLGVALAFANAGLFAAYIVLAHRVASDPAIAGIDGLAAAMLIAVVAVTPIAGWAALPAFADPAGARGGHRRRGLLVGDPLCRRSGGDGQAHPRRLLADGVAAPGHRDGRRPDRAHAGPDGRRRAGHRARHRGGGAPSRAHAAARRTTVAAAALISCSDAHSRGEW